MAHRERPVYIPSAQLAPLINTRQAAINPAISAELAPCSRDERGINVHLLPHTDFKRLALPYTAARAFAAYRKAGVPRTVPLPDFFIGTHAEAEGHTLITRDPRAHASKLQKTRAVSVEYFPKPGFLTPQVFPSLLSTEKEI